MSEAYAYTADFFSCLVSEIYEYIEKVEATNYTELPENLVKLSFSTLVFYLGETNLRHFKTI